MGSALVRAGCAILAVAAAVAVAACAAGSAGPAATHTSVEPPQPGLDLSRSPAALTLPVTNLAVAPDGKVWYSTGDFAIHPAGGGLNRLSGKILSHLADPLGLASGQDLNVQALTVGLDGAVWIGAGCAVGRFDGRAWQAIVSDCESLQGNVINIGLASDGTAWIATGFDLARYADGTMQSFDRLANWVAVAPDGTLWVSGWEGRADTSFVLRYDGVQWSAYDTARLHHA